MATGQSTSSTRKPSSAARKSGGNQTNYSNLTAAQIKTNMQGNGKVHPIANGFLSTLSQLPKTQATQVMKQIHGMAPTLGFNWPQQPQQTSGQQTGTAGGRASSAKRSATPRNRGQGQGQQARSA